ncbi:MAG: hypothetical protein IJU56_05785 [Clostridia bacterium]|nr:hypothetical protein [Clostridia bacterium]
MKQPFIRRLPVLCLLLALFALPANAASFSTMEAGDYPLDAELSCYVNAMGGVEFGALLLQKTQLHVSKDGSKTITLHLGKSQVTIYSVTCDTFVDAKPDNGNSFRGVKNGTLGYYDVDGALVTDGVTYTLSDATAENAAKQQVHYVDTVTFPVLSQQADYHLTLCINSNVMGVQFCDANDKTTENTFPAVLTVDWSSVGLSADSMQTETTTVPAAAPDDVEKEQKSGLNLYRVGDNTTTAQTTAEVSDPAAAGVAATINRPVLYAAGVVGILLLAGGLVLIILGKRERKKEENL